MFQSVSWGFTGITLFYPFLQARVAFERKEYQKAETFLLRAQRPELAARYYKVRNKLILK